ncbi:LysR family transcriptional regulator [Marivita sp. XM-24bin2]|jgi:DNA-binding transcriptional LysR family regulator|uniref:LysR family transcriptional regulator n=1 Tax=unclassified Marivita TaxID=2632480 RepID=UPI000D792FF3|nr:LysR family transcriptional regulator [Marivita sp. XM-24bin2]MCR9110113.1 LysR family transcriptional regulator [Paracoccaceae bacterium]PWL34267.1 MAG: LysR family transcriptional regulator [Marivita sp. XM-24bin2]
MQSWDDLRIFLSVARNDTLSGAGRALRMDPATVGRRVARLEESIGQALFVKSPQGYTLTEAGTRLIDHAERAEQAMQGAASVLTGEAGTLTGQIRIGAPDGCANFVLPRVCADLSKANPDLDLQIVALPRVVNLSRREADMAITVSPPTASRLSFQRITDYKLHLAASETYLSTRPPLTTVEDLRTHRIVGYIPDMIFDKELDYLSDLDLERVALASNSASVQIQILRQHGGIGIAHDFALPFAPGVGRVLTDALSFTRSFYLVRHAEDRRLDRITRFAAALAQGVRAEVTRLEALLSGT